MNWLLYWMGRAFVGTLQALPLRWVARLGRAGGTLAWWIDRRHRRVAIDNLRNALRQTEAGTGCPRSEAEVQLIAREHFRRLGETYCCAVKTAGMELSELRNHVVITGLEKLRGANGQHRSAVFAVGHFGNFELYPRGGSLVLPDFQFVSTYRALKQPGLNRLLVELRGRSGAWLFERRMDGDQLRAAMNQKKLIVGLFSDQHAGRPGAWIPFFGRKCSTTTAPAVFASRYKLPLFTAICYRTGLGQWRIEVGDEIPTVEGGQRRPAEEIMLDVNRAFEEAIRRDPANWFWVHKRWKPVEGRRRSSAALQDAAAPS